MDTLGITAHNDDWIIRAGSLHVITVMIRDLKFIQSAYYVPLMSTVLHMADDKDPRIRVIAFASIRSFLEDIPFISGWKTPYALGLNGLSDTDALVRLECVHLLS